MKPLACVFIVFFTSNLICFGSNELELKYPIIPTPQKIEYGSSELNFDSYVIKENDFSNEISGFEKFLKSKGIQKSNNGLQIVFEKKELANNFNDEGYKISIGEKIIIATNSNKGAFYAVQTLKQLFRKNGNQGVFPKLEITDWPAFKIRGFMHDTGRNFQSVGQLKEQIEFLSLYKYNVFHWHLTDDPAWRLESKLYPELQSDKATSRHKGKFYSQEDFKEIVAYCKERHITVIPEFDIPGHTEAFRKGLGIESMKDDKALPILKELFDELMSLVSPEDMPYIHIGTDEVRNKEEYVSKDFILQLMNHLKSKDRELIVWKEGIVIQEDSSSINQLWAYHERREGHRFIDSRSNYINHLDPFAGMARMYFQQPCRLPKGNELALGGVLCAWPDNNVNDERDILKQNPIYPSMVFYSDAIWKGRDKDYPEYWAKLPPINTQEFEAFQKFEANVIIHKNRFFQGKEFSYVKQTEISWNLIGPFDHHGEVTTTFPIESEIKPNYNVENKNYKWSTSHVGGTIHLKHFFGFPSITDATKGTFYAYTNIYSPNDRIQDFWVGFHGWSRSGGRRGGPFPSIGQWHTTEPKIWVNNTEINPPKWKQPNLGVKTDEIPFIDEDYFYRNPTKIPLKKGWNSIVLKIPKTENSWKWMFTCIPVSIDGIDVSGVEDLKFKSSIIKKIK